MRTWRLSRMSLRILKRRYERLREAKQSVESSSCPTRIPIPRDTVRFCHEWLFYDPYPYMCPFLKDESHFIANLQARQTGKTFNGMAKLLHLALLNSDSLPS
jgi:hypothetical protein